MTLYKYNLLNEQEQSITLWLQGEFIADRREHNYSILLYQIYSFYVEVWYEGKKNEIYKFRCFSSIQQLEPYLSKIDISGINQ